jgi:transcription elongation factor GreA
MAERMVSHVRLRRQGPKGKAVAAVDQRPEVKLTLEGKAALEQELDALKAERPRIAAELRAARADGDISENAPLDAAREAQAHLEARIRDLEATLRQAVIDDGGGVAPETSGDAARIGCSVVICNLATGTQLTYQLVNAVEARPGTGRLSVESPVGQALVGRRVGEEVQVAAPSGTVRFRIESVQG